LEKGGLSLRPCGHVAHCCALAKLPPKRDFSFWPSDFMKGQKEKYLYIDTNTFPVKAEWFLEIGNHVAHPTITIVDMKYIIS
jgi:hypothetical protein